MQVGQFPPDVAHRSTFDVALFGRDSALRELALRQVWFDHLLALSLVGDGAGRVGRAHSCCSRRRSTSRPQSMPPVAGI
jgi:hypothetical protein